MTNSTLNPNSNSENIFYNADSTRGANYFEIIKRSTSIINWLFLSILLFSGINFSMLYVWHFGNITDAISANNEDIRNFDKLYDKIKDKNGSKSFDNIEFLAWSDSGKKAAVVINSHEFEIKTTIKDTSKLKDSLNRAYIINYLEARINALNEIHNSGITSVMLIIN